MARIYDAQIQWQSPAGHRFNAEPLEDYISSGLDAVSQASKQVSEGIQKLRDREAADLMKKAGEEAQNYIDNFEDFSGDNYLNVMEANAMKIWDDAFATLDEPTKRRFEMNNPEARNIFNLKTHESAVDKSFNHQFIQYKRRIPSMASQIVALKEPDLIKKALAEEVYRLTENSNMRADDAEQIIDLLRYAVHDGAISQAIGEGNVEDAAAMNNDLTFSDSLTPSQRASNNKAIQSVLDAQEEEKKKNASLKKKYDVIAEALTNGTVYLYDEMYANAGRDTESRKKVTVEYNKFLSDFLEGDIKGEYGGVPVSKFFPEAKLFTDVPFSIRQKVVKDTVAATLENNPTDKRLKSELGYRAATLAASVPVDDDGYADISKITPEKMSDIAVVLEQLGDYYAFDDGVQKQIDKLRNMYVLYTDTASMALRPSAFQNENTLVAKATGLGWTTQKYMQSGNISPDVMDALRSGADNTDGVVFNEYYKEAMDSAIENFAYWTNNKKMPKSGTYREMLMQEAVTFANMKDADKKALGIENVSVEQIVKNYLEKVNYYDSLGILDSKIPDDMITGTMVNYVPGPPASIEAKDATENTEWYTSMESSIKRLNPYSMPDKKVLRSYSSANRSTTYKDWMDRASYFRFSDSASRPDKADRAHIGPSTASAKKIKVNKE